MPSRPARTGTPRTSDVEGLRRLTANVTRDLRRPRLGGPPAPAASSKATSNPVDWDQDIIDSNRPDFPTLVRSTYLRDRPSILTGTDGPLPYPSAQRPAPSAQRPAPSAQAIVD